jgi:flagellar biosynthesis protein
VLFRSIIDAARASDVPICQDPDLAAALSNIELDQEIPEALYKVVAQVLSYILRTAGHLR